MRRRVPCRSRRRPCWGSPSRSWGASPCRRPCRGPGPSSPSSPRASSRWSSWGASAGPRRAVSAENRGARGSGGSAERGPQGDGSAVHFAGRSESHTRPLAHARARSHRRDGDAAWSHLGRCVCFRSSLPVSFVSIPPGLNLGPGRTNLGTVVFQGRNRWRQGRFVPARGAQTRTLFRQKHKTRSLLPAIKVSFTVWTGSATVARL